MRRNPLWSWFRYQAEFDEDRLPLPGMLCVETGSCPDPTAEVREQQVIEANAVPERRLGMTSNVSRRDSDAEVVDVSQNGSGGFDPRPRSIRVGAGSPPPTAVIVAAE